MLIEIIFQMNESYIFNYIHSYYTTVDTDYKDSFSEFFMEHP